MSAHIVRQMPHCDFEIWEDCVRMQSMAESANETAADRVQELAGFRGLSSFEKLFKLEKDIIGDLISLKCPVPNCSRQFGDFDACAALTCHCGAHFCGLCLTGPFESDEDAHAHVAICPHRPPTMTDALFIDLESWRNHIADRQSRQINEYIDSTDMPTELKDRLRAHFAA